MAKRAETIRIEQTLHQTSREKRMYGCEEVTIGFQNAGMGKEVVDFLMMDSHGILRCYEIKVTLADLKSKAKKSWYGHFNYLVISSELYHQLGASSEVWREYVPEDVGLVVLEGIEFPYLQSVIKCKKRELREETATMLKESLARSLYYKMLKYKDASDIDKVKNLEKEVRHWKQEYQKQLDAWLELRESITRFTRLCQQILGYRVDLETLTALLEERKLQIRQMSKNNLGQALNFFRVKPETHSDVSEKEEIVCNDVENAEES